MIEREEEQIHRLTFPPLELVCQLSTRPTRFVRVSQLFQPRHPRLKLTLRYLLALQKSSRRKYSLAANTDEAGIPAAVRRGNRETSSSISGGSRFLKTQTLAAARISATKTGGRWNTCTCVGSSRLVAMIRSTQLDKCSTVISGIRWASTLSGVRGITIG